MDRRSMLKGVVLLAGGAVVDPYLGPAPNLLDLPEQRSKTAALWADYQRGEPGAIRAMERNGSALLGLHSLTRTRGDQHAAQVGSLAADAAQQTSCVLLKAGQNMSAMWWAEESERVAREAGAWDMAALATCRMSAIRKVANRDTPGYAVTVAARALDWPIGPHARVIVEIHLSSAHAMGSTKQDAYDALSALDRAEVALERAAGAEPPTVGLPPNLTAGGLAYYRADVLSKFQPDQAEPMLLDVLNRLPLTAMVARGEVQIRRAEAALRRGEVDTAATLAAEGYRLVLPGSVKRETTRVIRLHRALEPYRQVPAVRHLSSLIGAK